MKEIKKTLAFVLALCLALTPMTKTANVYAGEAVTTKTITLHASGTNIVSSNSVEYSSTLTYEVNNTTADLSLFWETINRAYSVHTEGEDYELVGWCLPATFTLATQEQFLAYATTHNTFELNAYFTTMYAVVFNTNGGIFSNGYQTKRCRVSSGSTFSSISENLTKTGYTFNGWYKDEALSQPMLGTDTITANMSVYAKFTPNTYDVTFMREGVEVENSAKTVVYASAYGDIFPEVTKAHYDLVGWSTEENKTEKIVTATTPVTATANHTLYAIFTPHNYTLTYELDGGTLQSANAVIPTSYNCLITNPILIGQPVKTGYTFKGWTVKKDGVAFTGTFNSYTLTNAADTLANYTFTANWEKNAEAIPTPTPTPVEEIKVDTTKVIGKDTYVVKKVENKDGKTVATEVSYKCADENATSVVIPKTVMIDGVAVPVTSIDAKAFLGCDKLKKVTIGENVTSIGAKAFFGCDKLKSVNLKSKVLKKVGSKAFKGIHPKAKFKVVKAKKKAYTKLLKKSTGFDAKTMKLS